MSRQPKTILAATALVVVAGVLAAALVAWRRECRAPIVVPEAATLTPEAVAHPGAPATATLTLKLPWGGSVAAATAVPGKGTVISGAPQISSEWRWGYCRWRVAVTVRPLASRGAEPGTLTLEFGRRFGAEAHRSARVALPAPKVEKPTAKSEEESPLRLAGAEVPAPEPSLFRRFWWLFALAAALLFALPALWWYRRTARNRAAAAVPPWELALAELAALRSDSGGRGFVAAEGVRRLSDILRDYLSSRFELAATTQTTEEFFASGRAEAALERGEDRAFLREFLAAADLVKFAQAPADPAALAPAIDRAEALVRSTVPRPEPAETEGAKS